ncbi:hypothetical protein Acr_00g0028320 [Actinidia rufa]|uniref:Uncharacterized protein n=1 Tax=Actinidia rufa TaxID=165716 RepID=A0A7J0DFL0_9ERIC|nr:hypothetical protein Acr_00g0028320 [Actinidia rufa]
MARAMTMRAAVTAAGPRALRGLFSTLSSSLPFTPPPTSEANRPPPPEPSTNLFVSGTTPLLRAPCNLKVYSL